MSDLRQNPQRLNELAAFILSREGFIPHFYCDDNGLVTIGIGTLVAGESDARRIAGDSSVRFVIEGTRRHATVDEVAADWRRVQATRGLGAGAYRKIAQLTLESVSVRYLMKQEISRSADKLYRTHPFLLSFDERVAMAFVDTRYNPAGINPYQSKWVRPLWAALDPRNPNFSLDTAVSLFEKLWANRGGHLAARYSRRHWQRTQWLRQGLEAMGATSGGLHSV
jgi:GH24 family phage-related lysozyme (muramidase)